MARRRTFNERRSSERQVEVQIASGRGPAPDMTAALQGAWPQSRVCANVTAAQAPLDGNERRRYLSRQTLDIMIAMNTCAMISSSR